MCTITCIILYMLFCHLLFSSTVSTCRRYVNLSFDVNLFSIFEGISVMSYGEWRMGSGEGSELTNTTSIYLFKNSFKMKYPS